MIRSSAILLVSACILWACSRSPSQDQAPVGKRQIALVLVQDSAVRIDPLSSSARITVLPTGENAEVTDRSRELGSVSGKQDYWYKIRLRSGITGWIWGQNIKVFAEGDNASVEKYARELRKDEENKARKELQGIWFSIVGEDTFTNHILSIKDDGTFSSLLKGADKPVEGEYTIDVENSILKFSKPAAFGDSINYIIRGEIYVLEVATDMKRIKFKRTSTDPSLKNVLPSQASPTPSVKE